jgi:regulator of replication initiation timing
MTIPMRLDSALPPIFKTLANGYEEISKSITNSVLMEFIYALKKQNQDLEDLLFTLENEPTLATTLDNDDFHDTMISLEDTLEEMLSIAKKHQDKTDIFQEFYKICSTLYSNIITLANEVSAIASEIRYEESKIAS